MPLSDTDLKYKDVSIKHGKHGGRGKLENINKKTDIKENEITDRDTDITRHYDTQRLDVNQRGQLWSDIGAQSGDRDATYFADRKKIKTWADLDHTRSTGIAGQVESATQRKLDAAKDQLDNKLLVMRNYLGRTAGSTRNCFVAHIIADTAKDFALQQAVVQADAVNRGIAAETEARRFAFIEGATAFLESNDKEQIQIDAKYGLLKDALQTHDEKQHTDDLINRTLDKNISENTIIVGAELYSEGWAEDRTDKAGAYAGKADELAAASATVG